MFREQLRLRVAKRFGPHESSALVARTRTSPSGLDGERTAIVKLPHMGDLSQVSWDAYRWLSRLFGVGMALFALFFTWLSASTAVVVIGHVGTSGKASIEYCGGAGTRSDPYLCTGPVTADDGRVLGAYSNMREEDLSVGDTLVVWDAPIGWARENSWTRGFSVLMASVGLALLGLGITMAGPRSDSSTGSTAAPKLRATMPLKILGGLGAIGAIAGFVLLAGA